MLGLKWRFRDFVYMFIAGLLSLIFIAIYYYATETKMVTIDEHHPEAQDGTGSRRKLYAP